MIKTVWINGTQRGISKNLHNVYKVFLDYNDVIWLNKIHKQAGVKSEIDIDYVK